jgi:hypothetical protein
MRSPLFVKQRAKVDKNGQKAYNIWTKAVKKRALFVKHEPLFVKQRALFVKQRAKVDKNR